MPLIQGVIHDIKDDFKAARKLPRPPWRVNLYVAVGVLLLCLALIALGRSDLAAPTVAFALAFGLLIWWKWGFRQFTWFRIALVILVALHVALILLLPWPAQWVNGPARGVIGIAFPADFIVILVLVDLVARFRAQMLDEPRL